MTDGYHPVLVQLPLVREATGTRCREPADVFRACADLARLAQEAFHVLCVDQKNMLVARHMITLGLVDSSLVHPREVFRPAIECNSASVILVHNHPSGDPTPSAEDLRITRQLVDAGKIIDIRVLDHVIVGRPSEGSPNGWLSLRESGLAGFA